MHRIGQNPEITIYELGRISSCLWACRDMVSPEEDVTRYVLDATAHRRNRARNRTQGALSKAMLGLWAGYTCLGLLCGFVLGYLCGL